MGGKKKGNFYIQFSVNINNELEDTDFLKETSSLWLQVLSLMSPVMNRNKIVYFSINPRITKLHCIPVKENLEFQQIS